MMFPKEIIRIKDKLALPLPGHAENLKFERKQRILFDKNPDENTRSSAVLILIYPQKGEFFVPFIQRPKYDGKHGGQISLPGGKKENNDENLVRTALRETQEEIGIKATDIHVLGALTEVFIPVSNFLVQPYVGFITYSPEFFPDAREVEKIIHTPLTYLQKDDLKSRRKIWVEKTEMEVTGFTVDDEWVWGATALIMSEFIEILKK
jgi:8-oxo-dGTP pyrophosphatase MutT (NUDIX family)